MIKGKTIYLRTVRETDLDHLYPVFCDLEARGDFFPLALPSEAIFKKEFQETGFWNDERGRLLICNESDRVVGGIWYFQTARYIDGYEIGYQMFDPGEHNKGTMTEALVLLTQYLFAAKKINRLHLAIMLPNKASRRVAEKAGYTLEGIARGAVYHNGENHDLEIWSILRGEQQNP
jgi:RimJ/RimL family protein N-acetyltransferase